MVQTNPVWIGTGDDVHTTEGLFDKFTESWFQNHGNDTFSTYMDGNTVKTDPSTGNNLLHVLVGLNDTWGLIEFFKTMYYHNWDVPNKEDKTPLDLAIEMDTEAINMVLFGYWIFEMSSANVAQLASSKLGSQVSAAILMEMHIREKRLQQLESAVAHLLTGKSYWPSFKIKDQVDKIKSDQLYE